MKQWYIKNKALILYISLALVIGVGVGGMIWGIEDTTNPETAEIETVGNVGKPTILPDTPVQVNYCFLLCGHTLTKDETGGNFTSCTLEDITRKYIDARVLELSSENAIIERELEKFCPEHFTLYSNEEGELCVLNTNATNFEKDEIRVLNYDVSVFSGDAISILEEGMQFDSLEEINVYLEDPES